MRTIFKECHDCLRRRYGFCPINLWTENWFERGPHCPYDCRWSEYPPHFTERSVCHDKFGQELMV